MTCICMERGHGRVTHSPFPFEILVGCTVLFIRPKLKLGLPIP